MGCSKSTSFSHGVRLEYSTDCGRHWSLITPECVPPAIGCAGYTQSSIYTSTQYKHWRRITVYLPSAAKYVFLFPQLEVRIVTVADTVSSILTFPSFSAIECLSSPRTRFRWIQTHFTPGAEGWALDNVLLAPGCPWMCSGHGLCDNGRCVYVKMAFLRSSLIFVLLILCMHTCRCKTVLPLCSHTGVIRVMEGHTVYLWLRCHLY